MIVALYLLKHDKSKKSAFVAAMGMLIHLYAYRTQVLWCFEHKKPPI